MRPPFLHPSFHLLSSCPHLLTPSITLCFCALRMPVCLTFGPSPHSGGADLCAHFIALARRPMRLSPGFLCFPLLLHAQSPLHAVRHTLTLTEFLQARCWGKKKEPTGHPSERRPCSKNVLARWHSRVGVYRGVALMEGMWGALGADGGHRVGRCRCRCNSRERVLLRERNLNSSPNT